MPSNRCRGTPRCTARSDSPPDDSLPIPPSRYPSRMPLQPPKKAPSAPRPPLSQAQGCLLVCRLAELTPPPSDEGGGGPERGAMLGMVMGALCRLPKSHKVAEGAKAALRALLDGDADLQRRAAQAGAGE
eukprot:1193760-Prorocentrum_minimum.AAC.1